MLLQDVPEQSVDAAAALSGYEIGAAQLAAAVMSFRARWVWRPRWGVRGCTGQSTSVHLFQFTTVGRQCRFNVTSHPPPLRMRQLQKEFVNSDSPGSGGLHVSIHVRRRRARHIPNKVFKEGTTPSHYIHVW